MHSHDLIKQKYIEKSLINVLSLFDLGPAIVLFWKDGVVFEVVVDAISSSDNGKELDDPCFMDYEAAYVVVKRVIECTLSVAVINERFGPMVYPGIGYEISFFNAPDKILKDGVVIWEKPMVPESELI